METRKIEKSRNTRETQIEILLDLDTGAQQIDTGLPFFDHILNSMSYHGGFGLHIKARGDLEVDAHHLVEDTGIVLGSALYSAVETYGPVKRFGHSVIPMDEALSEAIVDVSGRPYLVYQADYPQSYCGDFPVDLLNEFLYALALNGKITLHALCRYGRNSHHMAEALFKAIGRAFQTAYRRNGSDEPVSTKGIL